MNMKLLNEFFTIDEQEVTEEKTTFRLTLHAEHLIYRAHFPGNPITPGVCLVQMQKECLETLLHRELFLSVVKNIKFQAVLSPTETTKVCMDLSKVEVGEEECKASALIYNAGKPYAKISAVYKYASF